MVFIASLHEVAKKLFFFFITQRCVVEPCLETDWLTKHCTVDCHPSPPIDNI